MASKEKTLALIAESLSLKRRPRMGWLESGAPSESVAEHSFGAAIISLALARMEKLAPEEEAALVRRALLHDLHEARTGDLSRLQRQYVSSDHARAEGEMLKGTHLEGEIALLQFAGRAPARQAMLARLCADADKLDMLFQAIGYHNAGNRNMARFFRSALSQVKSKSGKRLAKMAMNGLKR